MSPALGVALAVAAAISLQAIIFLVLTLPLAPFARVEISKAVLGFGPRLFSFRAGGTPVEVMLLPLTSYASAVGGNPYIDDPPPAPPRLLWPDAPVGRRVIAFALAPRLAGTVVPLFVLGPARTLSAIVHGMSEVFAAFGWGRPILDHGARVLATEGWSTLFALALCKTIGFALVVLPFDLLYTAVTPAMASFVKTVAKVRALVMFAWLALTIAWLFTWARWAF